MRIDPVFIAPISHAIEKAINEIITYDPATCAQLTALQNESLAVIIEDWQSVFSIQLLEKGCSVTVHSLDQFSESDASITISGQSKDYLSLLAKRSKSLAGSGIRASGNIGVLEQFKVVLENLDIDWQDALYQKFGAASLPIAKAISKSRDYTKDVSTAGITAVKEYIEHESSLFVHKDQFKIFEEKNTDLRSASDRLDARLQQLARKLSQL